MADRRIASDIARVEVSQEELNRVVLGSKLSPRFVSSLNFTDN